MADGRQRTDAAHATAMTKPLATRSARRTSSDCARCSLRRVCVWSRNDHSAVRTRAHAVHSRRFAAGDALYRAGARAGAIYAVRDGCVKETVSDGHGGEILLGFRLPGEASGLGCFATGRFPSHAVALTDTVCCELPLSAIQQLANEAPDAAHELARLLAQLCVDMHERLAILGVRDARARVAGFLVDLSARLHARGLDGHAFRLHMSRADIGAYLGLALETVSRSLAQLARERLIRVSAKRIVLLQPRELARIAPQLRRVD